MTRARRDLRWREQAARLVDESQRVCTRRRGSADRRITQILRGDTDAHFDVALVRAYCERLISEADTLDLQRDVFADWTRDRGMGPENREPGAFGVLCPGCGHARHTDMFVTCSCGHTSGTIQTKWGTIEGGNIHGPAPGDRPGGWPGSLAREYVATQRARHRCSRRDCESGVLTGDFVKHMSAAAKAGGSMTITATDDGCGVACPECERFAATRTPRTFANGGSLRRAAQRLLDTLDGRCPWAPDAEAQASECTHCCYAVTHDEEGRAWATRGRGWVDAGVLRSDVNAPLGHVPGAQVRLRECPACNGAGHNLRGTLPPLPAETVERLRQPTEAARELAQHFTAADFDRMLHDLQHE